MACSAPPTACSGDFGLARCYNTPLAEANIVGRAVGQAVRGLRPAPEVQFFDYIWTAMQQIKSEAATIRWRSNGAFSCPMVLRVPIGGYLTGGAIWHSQSGESIFAHIPGLIVVMPSRARDAVGLLRTAFAGRRPGAVPRAQAPAAPALHPGSVSVAGLPDSVRTRERGASRRRPDHRHLRRHGGEVPAGGRRLGRRRAARSRSSTCARWSRGTTTWSAESVARTGRVLVVHEDVLTCGFGAEVAAWVGEHCFADLDAPVRRVGAADTHVAYEPAPRAGHPAPGRRHPGRRQGHPRLLIGGRFSHPKEAVMSQQVRGVMLAGKGRAGRHRADHRVPIPVRVKRWSPSRPAGCATPTSTTGRGRSTTTSRFCSATRRPGPSRRSAPDVTGVAPGDYVVIAWRAPVRGLPVLSAGPAVVLLRLRATPPSR